MKIRHFLGLSCALVSCQLLFLPDKALFLENTVLTCFDGVDNDQRNGADCADPSCEALCNDDQLTLDSLTHNNCAITTHEAITGDDRGGLAVGVTQVLYSGDDRTAAFDLDSLAETPFGFLYNAPFSDLRSGTLFTLIRAGAPMDGTPGTIDGFQEINPQDGALVGPITALSEPIFVSEDTGLFSGKGRLVIHSQGVAYDLDLTTGAVTTLELPAFAHQLCETWAYWGVAEFVGEQLSLVYVSDANTVSRKRLANFSEEVVTRFPTLGDMCSISVSPSRSRWYFHGEQFTSMSGLSEQLGYCDAILDGLPPTPVCGDGIFQAPEGCDDGNGDKGDGCTDCQLDTCGDNATNNVIQGNPGEQCDDGNTSFGDGCRGDCIGSEVCGDFLVDVNEQCDDGNNLSGDGCEADCTFACGAQLSPKMAFAKLGGGCYVVLGNPTDWNTARQQCIDASGELAALTDSAENALVFPAAVNFEVWIGLNDIASEDTFAWSNGEPLTFTNFAPGEPNSSGGDEDCVAFKSVGWIDDLCGNGRKPLCELP